MGTSAAKRLLGRDREQTSTTVARLLEMQAIAVAADQRL